MTHVLLAGATGYLGTHLLRELVAWDIPTTAIARSPHKLSKFDFEKIVVKQAEVTNVETLKGLFDGISTVISTVGITRQKDGLTYMDVDYQANMNLLEEAKEAGVKKFIYVSALGGEKFRHLQICSAKERFVDALRYSGMNYTVVRPNGFYSDMLDVLQMAKNGKVYVFGNGEQKLNPIHGADLAEVIINTIAMNEHEILVGGPDILTHNEIAEIALASWGNPNKIVHLPDVIRSATIHLARIFTSEKTFGPLEFFLTLMGQDMIAPRYGTRRLQDFYKQEVKNLKL